VVRSSLSVLAIADDLPGAAEVAALVKLREPRILLIHPDAPVWPAVDDSTELLVLDLGSRAASSTRAAQLLTAAIDACGTGRVIYRSMIEAPRQAAEMSPSPAEARAS